MLMSFLLSQSGLIVAAWVPELRKECCDCLVMPASGARREEQGACTWVCIISDPEPPLSSLPLSLLPITNPLSTGSPVLYLK